MAEKSITPNPPAQADRRIPEAAIHYDRGNAPRRWQDYLAYPRILFTAILCFLALILHIAFGIYVWLYEK